MDAKLGFARLTAKNGSVQCACLFQTERLFQLLCIWGTFTQWKLRQFIPSSVLRLSRQTSVGHLQALSVRAQAEAGLPGALAVRPEEAQEEKPGKALIQVRDQRERGETETTPTPTFPLLQNVACTCLILCMSFSSNGSVACLCSDAAETNMTSVRFMWGGGEMWPR